MYCKPGQGHSQSDSINHLSKRCHENINWSCGATEAVKHESLGYDEASYVIVITSNWCQYVYRHNSTLLNFWYNYKLLIPSIIYSCGTESSLLREESAYLLKCKAWHWRLSSWSISTCVYVCVCLQKPFFLSLELKYCIYIFPDGADWNFGFKFCNAEDEIQLIDGYSKQVIDSCKRQTFPRRECCLSKCFSSKRISNHPWVSKQSYVKKRQLFQCLRSKIPEFHDALWLKEGLHSQTHGYSIAAVIARMHARTHT